jgi:hypothetical protein
LSEQGSIGFGVLPRFELLMLRIAANTIRSHAQRFQLARVDFFTGQLQPLRGQFEFACRGNIQLIESPAVFEQGAIAISSYRLQYFVDGAEYLVV